MNIRSINFGYIFIVCGGGRVYEIIRFFREWLANPPLRIWYICIVCGGGRVYYIIRFYRELLANPPLQTQNIVGAGSPTIYETDRQSHKPAPSPPLFI